MTTDPTPRTATRSGQGPTPDSSAHGLFDITGTSATRTVDDAAEQRDLAGALHDREQRGHRRDLLHLLLEEPELGEDLAIEMNRHRRVLLRRRELVADLLTQQCVEPRLLGLNPLRRQAVKLTARPAEPVGMPRVARMCPPQRRSPPTPMFTTNPDGSLHYHSDG